MTQPSLTRIGRALTALRAAGGKGLIAYVTAGDPDLDTTYELVLALAQAGADVVELGLPFSDPLADGPDIQAAVQRSLAAGTTPAKVLDLIARLRASGAQVPLAILTYFNPVLRMGPAAFVAAAAQAGADGLIIPDLPLEEAAPVRDLADGAGLDLIPLVAPTSPPERVASIAKSARGFVYCVSLTGVTGARATLSDRFRPLVAEVRRHTDLPVAVGFGVSKPEHAREVAQVADAAIVGSAFVRLVAGPGTRSEKVRRVAELAAALKAAMAGA